MFFGSLFDFDKNGKLSFLEQSLELATMAMMMEEDEEEDSDCLWADLED